MQSVAWAIAGISAIPFALAGELGMLALGLVTLLFAIGASFVAIGVVWRRRWARRVALVLEFMSVIGSLLLFVLPIGANHGPVALITNLVMPLVVIALLWRSRLAFA